MKVYLFIGEILEFRALKVYDNNHLVNTFFVNIGLTFNKFHSPGHFNFLQHIVYKYFCGGEFKEFFDFDCSKLKNEHWFTLKQKINKKGCVHFYHVRENRLGSTL